MAEQLKSMLPVEGVMGGRRLQCYRGHEVSKYGRVRAESDESYMDGGSWSPL